MTNLLLSCLFEKLSICNLNDKWEDLEIIWSDESCDQIISKSANLIVWDD